MASVAEIPALPAEEVVAFLKRVGLFERFESGDLTCLVCGSALADAGLGAAKLSDGEIVFGCQKLECLEDFHRRSA